MLLKWRSLCDDIVFNFCYAVMYMVNYLHVTFVSGNEGKEENVAGLWRLFDVTLHRLSGR
jgi:hypothetical protein